MSIRLTGGTGTGAVFQIGGLPFSSYNGTAYTTGGVNVGYQEGVFSGDKSFHIAQNVTVIRVYNNNGTPFTGNQTTIVNKYLNFFGSYIVNH